MLRRKLKEEVQEHGCRADRLAFLTLLRVFVGSDAMPKEPSSNFGIETKMEAQVRLSERLPWAIIPPKIDAAISQTIVVRDAIPEEETNDGEIGHVLGSRPEYVKGCCVPQFRLWRTLDNFG